MGDVVRACAFALATAEFARRGRMPAREALEAIAVELDEALRVLGIDIGPFARVYAAQPSLQDN
jgi:hypothetical protein